MAMMAQEQEYQQAAQENTVMEVPAWAQTTNTGSVAVGVPQGGESPADSAEPNCWTKFYNWMNNLFTMQEKTHLIVKFTLLGLGALIFCLSFVMCCCCCSTRRPPVSVLEAAEVAQAAVDQKPTPVFSENTCCRGFWLSAIFFLFGGSMSFLAVMMLLKKMWLEKTNTADDENPLMHGDDASSEATRLE